MIHIIRLLSIQGAHDSILFRFPSCYQSHSHNRSISQYVCDFAAFFGSVFGLADEFLLDKFGTCQLLNDLQV